MSTIVVPDNDVGRTVQLVISCTGTSDQFKVEKDDALKFDVPNGAPEAGPSTVFQAIAQASSRSAELLGSTPEANAQVLEWLTWANTQLAPLMDDKLIKVNEWLQTRMYLVNNTLTLADIVVFGTVHTAVSSFPAAQTLHFANLLRWADLLQHTIDTQGIFAPVKLVKPKFKPPPPPAPAPPKASKDTSAALAATTAAPAAAPAGKPAPAGKAAAPATPAAGKQQQPATKGTPAAPGAAAPAPAAAPAAPAADKKAAKKEAKKEKASGEAKAGEGAAKAGDEVSIDMLDIRIGTIVKVGQHPNADALYLEEIDVGEATPRQVISGLVKFVPVEQMQGRRVLVVCNLKPAKMREVMSYGMVLCASSDAHDQVEPVLVPEGVPNGERVTFEGYTSDPLVEVNPKKKILERLFPDMRTDAGGVCVFKGASFMTSRGPITSTIPNANVR